MQIHVLPLPAHGPLRTGRCAADAVRAHRAERQRGVCVAPGVLGWYSLPCTAPVNFKGLDFRRVWDFF